MFLAEAVRFELTNGCPLPVFKTGAIDHSATPPTIAFTLPQPSIFQWAGEAYMLLDLGAYWNPEIEPPGI